MYTWNMESLSDAKVLNVDKVRDGILVEFSNLQCVIYPTALLLEMIPAAIKVEDSAPDDLGEPA